MAKRVTKRWKVVMGKEVFKHKINIIDCFEETYVVESQVYAN